MSTNEGPAPDANGNRPTENAAAKPPLAAQSTGAGDSSPPVTLAMLGRLLREEGMARASDALDRWTRSCWQTGINYWASTGIPFGADDVRELGVPEPTSPGAVGALFMSNCRAGVIQPHGFAQSRKPSRHASWQRQWIGGESAA